MPSTITLTAANIVADGFNSSLVYNFPNSSNFQTIALLSPKLLYITVGKISMPFL